jgi:hypothetical protein
VRATATEVVTPSTPARSPPSSWTRTSFGGEIPDRAGVDDGAVAEHVGGHFEAHARVLFDLARCTCPSSQIEYQIMTLVDRPSKSSRWIP